MQKSSGNTDEIQVKLKPILGIKPTTYVPVFYGIALLLIVFLLLILPGIRNYGSVVRFASAPADSSVRVDGARVATSPGSVFVRAGTHNLEIVHPGFQPYRSSLTIRGRLFGSLIFPRRLDIHVALEPADIQTAIDATSVEFGE